MLIKRQVSDFIEKSKRSILLIGPRQTGKSTLLRATKPDLVINLADEGTYFQHLKDPHLLRDKCIGRERILIDEIQRLPSLLNTVQALIDEDQTKQFLLAGSSARKLKRGHANLLPGRVIYHQLGPLTFLEAESRSFDLNRALTRGMLPGIYLDETKEWKSLLKSYAALYLREEVQAEL